MRTIFVLCLILFSTVTSFSSSISGVIFYDDNMDGCRADTEEFSHNILIELYACNDDNIPRANDLLIKETRSDEMGSYSFDLASVQEGNYYVKADLRQNRATTANCDSDIDLDGNSTCFSLTASDTIVVNVGLVARMYVGGHIIVDNNANGIWEPDENPIGEYGKILDIHLLNKDKDVLQTTSTGVKGEYYFETDPGEYYIQYMPPSSIPLSAPDHTEANSDIKGDDNGIQDDTDGNNVTDGLIITTLITLERGQEPTNDPELTFEWGWGIDDRNDNLTIDFLLVPLMGIGGEIFIDDNIDGFHSPGEGNIGDLGIAVSLNLFETETDSLVAVTNTDAQGSYFFSNLFPGDYYVEFVPPASAPRSSPVMFPLDNDIDDDNNGIQQDNDNDSIPDGLITSPSINLYGYGEPNDWGSGFDENINLTIDFGLLRCYRLEGTTYEDLDDNGCRDSDELTGTHELIWSIYQCDSLPAEFGMGHKVFEHIGSSFDSDIADCLTTERNYYLEVQSASGDDIPSFVPRDLCHDWKDSDVDSQGQSDCFSLYEGFNISNIDIGFVGPSSTAELSAEQLTIYPNPAIDKLDIKTISKIKQWRIIDVAGRTAIKEAIAPLSNEVSVEIYSLEKGTYILEVITKLGTGYRKFIIE